MLDRLVDRIGSLFAKKVKPHQGARRQNPQAELTSKQVRRGNYHCVEVHGGHPACETVKRLDGNRFLPDEAPGLPMPGCNAQTCTCRYVHHEDRREDDRRNAYRQWSIDLPDIDGERRDRNDRRKSSENAFKPTMAY